jgi:hypothetical protein
MMPLAEVLDLARWAPSGDNTQPWRFALETADRVAVFGHDTRAHCVYDLDGHPSQISLGALLETMALAGTRFGLAAQIDRRKGSPDDKPVFDVRFRREAGIVEDPLVSQIRERRVQRRPLRLRYLTQREKQVLEDAVKPGFHISWWEGWKGRAKFALLNFSNAKIRLTLPEAYRVHRDAIEWGARFSEDRVPDAALGAIGIWQARSRPALSSTCFLGLPAPHIVCSWRDVRQPSSRITWRRDGRCNDSG